MRAAQWCGGRGKGNGTSWPRCAVVPPTVARACFVARLRLKKI